MRVFIAIDLSLEAKKEIEKFYKKVLFKKHWPVGWVKVEKLHITLAFLGNFDKVKNSKLKDQNYGLEFSVEQIIKCIILSTKHLSPFEISFKGLGCFPGFDYPRVIWLGLKGNLKNLAMLQKNLEKALKNIGFNLAIRPFSPHITLGRIKNECQYKERIEIGRQLRRYTIYDPGSPAQGWSASGGKITIDKVIVYESKLKPTGSVYKRLLEIKFAKNSNCP